MKTNIFLIPLLLFSIQTTFIFSRDEKTNETTEIKESSANKLQRLNTELENTKKEKIKNLKALEAIINRAAYQSRFSILSLLETPNDKIEEFFLSIISRVNADKVYALFDKASFDQTKKELSELDKDKGKLQEYKIKIAEANTIIEQRESERIETARVIVSAISEDPEIQTEKLIHSHNVTNQQAFKIYDKLKDLDEKNAKNNLKSILRLVQDGFVTLNQVK